MPGPTQQATGSSGATTTCTVTLGAPPAAGTTLVVEVLSGGTTNQLCNAPTCTGVSNWNRRGSSNGGATSHAEIWAGDVGASAGNVVTITHPVAHTFRANASEWPNLTQTGGTGTGQFNTPSSTTISTAGLTPATSGVAAVIFACVTNTTGSVNTPPTSGGFTELNTANASHRQAYLEVASTAGPYTSVWTNSIATVSETVICVLYVAGGGGGSFKSAFARNANSYLSSL